MSQAVNPNTSVPTTLQVERIQQLQNSQEMQLQGHLAQKAEQEKKRDQQRVKKDLETDEVLIHSKEEDNSQKGQKKKKHGKNKEKKQEPGDLEKGTIIDVSV